MSARNKPYSICLKIVLTGVLCALILSGYSLRTDAAQTVIRFHQAQVHVLRGKSRKLHFSCSGKYKLSSTDKSVATVSRSGTVKGKKAGKCWIVCKCGNTSARIRVKVMNSIRSDELLFIGHRGYQDKYPENTIQSFKGALKYGAAGVEFDLWHTRSGDLLAFHDSTLKRMCGKNINIQDITKSTRSRYPVRAHGKKAKIPTLEEALSCLKKKNAVAFIHLKHGSGPVYYGKSADKVAQCIRRTGMTGKSVVFCSTYSTLSYFHSHHPDITTGYLFMGGSEKAAKADMERFGRAGISYFYFFWPKDISYSLVKYAHKRGLKVGTYKTRKKGEILDLLDYKADFCMLYHKMISR
ncbi:MAG: hypothetical protein II640_00415 [Lachnospiraceae bacterium]|nr:hypothetical protein [Lachnospiraceae bacterium]